jgi:hypothetical protein
MGLFPQLWKVLRDNTLRVSSLAVVYQLVRSDSRPVDFLNVQPFLKESRTKTVTSQGSVLEPISCG